MGYGLFLGHAGKSGELTRVASIFCKKKNMSQCAALQRMNKLTSETLVGKTVKEAEEHIKLNDVAHDGLSIEGIRVTSVDGEEMMVSMDYDDWRLNVSTVDGIIVKIDYVG